ncbi:sensor histidine kinase KdpD [Oscillospiraceae bacterium CM]|nr:sensor histidine kinase KdpD [Oscillospiraceae bacterium CM]
MSEVNDGRPDPDALLESIHLSEPRKEGKLKIFFGFAAGVGKTYAMLDDAREQQKNDVDVLVGYLEPHTRPETMSLLEGLPVLQPQTIQYRNIQLKEFDLDAALKRQPELILVDELAHTNAEGVRNKKRYQDIEELLKAGINVYTTVNVQHIESLNDIVQNITKVRVRETIPDAIFDRADMVKLIDIEPDELLRRFEAGKIYRPERARTAMDNFFTKGNLRLLREIAMRKATDRVSHDNQNELHMAEKMASTRLLVCIGPSPSSAKCIRWTARTADSFHAPWVAAYVDCLDSQNISEEDKKNIRLNMDLAEELGGEIVTLNGDDIATIIASYAKLSGITNIVVGKSRNKKTFLSYFETDLEDKLIALLPTVELHIIPGIPGQKRYKKPRRKILSQNISLSWSDTIKALGYLVLATLLCFVLKALEIGDQNIIMVYILSVLTISRTTQGYFYGVFFSILSVLVFNFFFTVPYYTFNAIQPGYPVTFAVMLLVALVTSAMTVRVKTNAQQAVERERRTKVLYEINKKLLVTRGNDNITALTTDYITKLFSRSAVFYTQDPENNKQFSFKQAEAETDASVLFSADERAVAHWVFLNLKNAGAGTDTLMGASGYYVPVIAQGKPLGVIGVSCLNGKLSQDRRLYLQMIVSQVALALERQILSDEQRKILIDSEKEKMRSNLLRAISHDLRTPLTCIFGSSQAILESGESLDRETHVKLLTDIKEESQWLIRMVENILSVTRINEGTSSVIKTPEAAEEIVAEAISRIRKRFPERKIAVKVPDQLLIVPMDGTLIEQVLINLLENAVKHSGNETNIDVIVSKNAEDAVFEVLDNGEGISEQDLPYVFDSYAPDRKRSADSSRNMGIGLSICMSIIKSHNGSMEATNRKKGGAAFKFTLPLVEEQKDGE